jgi:hypothetical protein
MNTTDNLETIRASIAPEHLPARRARFRLVSERICINVARVSCPDEGRVRPEAFIEPAPRGKKRPKALATELTTHPKSNSISRHTPHEIFALTRTKQTIAAPISRHKTDPPIFVNLSSGLTGSTDLLDKRQHARR